MHSLNFANFLLSSRACKELDPRELTYVLGVRYGIKQDAPKAVEHIVSIANLLAMASNLYNRCLCG